MSEQTNIAWANFTASPWLICAMVSAGCKNCYAMLLATRYYAKLIRKAYRKAGYKNWRTMPLWGPKAPRVLTKSFWTNVRRWNRKAANAPSRPRMFMSMMDWLDDFPAGVIDQDGNRLDGTDVRARLVRLMYECSNLDWLLLTKRIENFRPLMLKVCFRFSRDGDFRMHEWLARWLYKKKIPYWIWVGVSAEDQKTWDERVPKLREIAAIVRWVSLEPLLERVVLRGVTDLDWVVVGGESGWGRRDCGVEAIENAVEQCVAAGVEVFCKQDCHVLPGSQGRIRPDVWRRKEIPQAVPF